jgi:hypothetical protein
MLGAAFSRPIGIGSTPDALWSGVGPYADAGHHPEAPFLPSLVWRLLEFRAQFEYVVEMGTATIGASISVSWLRSSPLLVN